MDATSDLLHLLSLMLFVVVLFYGADIMPAILFGKVLRIQSQAQVIFSDPIVIRFGSGVSDVDGGRAAEASTDTEKKIPCPVLEFRIANRLFNEVGGEIMDGRYHMSMKYIGKKPAYLHRRNLGFFLLLLRCRSPWRSHRCVPCCLTI